MTHSTYKKSRGFTLIELLTVIAIIATLSSVVVQSTQSARLRANDARKRQDARSIMVALNNFFAQNGSFPTNPNLCCGAISGTNEWNTVMNQLVSGGFLRTIPTPPDATQYGYYDYGRGNAIGAFVYVSDLQSTNPSTTGLAGTCRPFAAGTNWCSQSSNREFCLCNPY